jgi:class 3 adenylate cyclase
MRGGAKVADETSAAGGSSFKSRLFYKYSMLIGTLVSAILIAAGSVEMFFSYQETKSALLQIQHEKAIAAAASIDRFLKEIKAQMGWTAHTPFLVVESPLLQRRIDFLRLLRQAPQITDVAYIDFNGREQVLVSRLSIDAVASNEDYSEDPKFHKALSDGSYVSPVYFRRDTEPYLSLSLKDRGQEVGVTVAEVNLKFVWDLISQINVGRSGHAFVVDSSGQLIAHPDISRVLAKTDLSATRQVAAAQAAVKARNRSALGSITEGIGGQQVLSSYAAILPLGWIVFVESPLVEAFEPLYDALIRTAAVIVGGIILSLLASLLLARRIVQPIKSLREGAGLIGAGALDQRIDIKTGDELEALAEEFNEMTTKLRQSYENVERIGALKRYFSPHLAELIVSSDGEGLTESHRSDITVLFCDLRNFTAFSSTAEPEDAMQVLEQYYVALGTKLREFEATIGHFAGDGLMAFFNDPLPCPDHAVRAVRMAVAMRESVQDLLQDWRRRGLDLGFGIGIATGYATLGHISTGDQFHYTAIGSVVNLASRLCDEARNGEILISETLYAEAENLVMVEPEGKRQLKGLPKEVPILKMVGIEKCSS